MTEQVHPVWTYSGLALLVTVLLLTDFLRFQPVIILEGLTYVAASLLVLVGPGVHSAQLALFSHSIAMAADVAYFSHIYSLVQPNYFQRVTSYVGTADLLGRAAGVLLAPLCAIENVFYSERSSSQGCWENVQKTLVEQ